MSLKQRPRDFAAPSLSRTRLLARPGTLPATMTTSHVAPSMASGNALLICRGNAKLPDWGLACVGQTTKPNHYAAVVLSDGQVVDRTLYRGADRALVQQRANDFRGAVFVDQRDEPGLLPGIDGAHELDFELLGRSKSDSEQQEMLKLQDVTHASLRLATEGSNERTFRSSVNTHDVDVAASGFKMRTRPGFYEYRGGNRGPSGLHVELSHIVPRNDTYRGFLDQCHAGFEEVIPYLQENVTVPTLNKLFCAGARIEESQLKGNVVEQTGWAPVERYRGQSSALRANDTVRLNASVVGPDGDVVHLFRSVHVVPEPEPYRGDDGRSESPVASSLSEDVRRCVEEFVPP